MSKYSTIEELYNNCSLIMNKFKDNKLDSYLNIKKIRKLTPKKILNTFTEIGILNKNIASQLNIKARIIKLSTDTLIKNRLEHPELSLEAYKNLSIYIKTSEIILKKGNKHLIYFKIDGKIYQFVIKITNNKDELFLTTFHKSNIKQLTKDIKRYPHIKIDNSDYEDSKYPSVT